MRVFIILIAFIFGCDEESTVGSIGSRCDDDLTCDDDLVCVLFRGDECPGSYGCPCDDNNPCNDRMTCHNYTEDEECVVYPSGFSFCRCYTSNTQPYSECIDRDNLKPTDVLAH